MSDSIYSHEPTPSSSTAPPTTTPIEHQDRRQERPGEVSSGTRHTSEHLNTAHYNYEHSISPEHTNTTNKTFNLAYKCMWCKKQNEKWWIL